MTYADKLLADGESVVLRTRQHWMALVRESRNGWLLWILAVVVLVAIPFFNVQPGPVRDGLSVLALLLLLVGVAIVLWQWLLWWTEEYLVTNRRLMKVSGVINKRSADSSLEKINDAILTQRFWGRVFNYGDLDILTAADTPVDSYYMLNAAPAFKKTMLNEKHALEMQYSVGRVPRPRCPRRQPPTRPKGSSRWSPQRTSRTRAGPTRLRRRLLPILPSLLRRPLLRRHPLAQPTNRSR